MAFIDCSMLSQEWLLHTHPLPPEKCNRLFYCVSKTFSLTFLALALCLSFCLASVRSLSLYSFSLFFYFFINVLLTSVLVILSLTYVLYFSVPLSFCLSHSQSPRRFVRLSQNKIRSDLFSFIVYILFDFTRVTQIQFGIVASGCNSPGSKCWEEKNENKNNFFVFIDILKTDKCIRSV